MPIDFISQGEIFNMHTLVVYFSKFGNTHQIADTIAGAIARKTDVTTIDFGHLTLDHLTDLDLLVMGSPTHNMNLPKTVKPVFENFPKRSLPGIPVAAFEGSPIFIKATVICCGEVVVIHIVAIPIITPSLKPVAKPNRTPSTVIVLPKIVNNTGPW